MGRCPGVPFDPGPSHGSQNPTEVIAHRTYGRWNGDYAVGKGSRGSISFHFLVGKDEGQWVQFVDTNRVAYHAKGDNVGTIGIEVGGSDADVMTDWQVRALGHICRWISDEHDIPLVKYRGGRTSTFHGWRDHRQVAGSDHTDGWTESDWARIVAAAAELEDDMFGDLDRSTLYAAASRQPWAFRWGQSLHTVHVTGRGDLVHSTWTGDRWVAEKVGAGCDPAVEPVVIVEGSVRIRVFCRSADASTVVHTVYEAGDGRWSSGAIVAA